jgi:hypothetical protein
MVPASSCTNQAQVYLLVACNTSYDCFCCSYVNSGWYGTVWYSMVPGYSMMVSGGTGTGTIIIAAGICWYHTTISII